MSEECKHVRELFLLLRIGRRLCTASPQHCTTLPELVTVVGMQTFLPNEGECCLSSQGELSLKLRYRLDSLLGYFSETRIKSQPLTISIDYTLVVIF